MPNFNALPYQDIRKRFCIMVNGIDAIRLSHFSISDISTVAAEKL